MLRCADRGLTHHETWSVLVELREDDGLDPDGGGERFRQQPAEKAILSLSLSPKFWGEGDYIYRAGVFGQIFSEVGQLTVGEKAANDGP